MYVQRNVEARSRNNCCSGRTISITYLCVCVRACEWVVEWVGAQMRACACAHVASNITHTTCRRTVLCGLSGHTTFFDIRNSTIFGGRGGVLKIKCVFWFSLQRLVETSHSNKNSTRYYYTCEHLYLKYPSFLTDFNETWIFSTGFWKNLEYQIS